MKIIKKLGAGAFSNVYYVKLENGEYGAMKTPRKYVDKKEAVTDSNNEIEFLKKFTTSKHVINMLEYEVNEFNNHIVLEPLGEELEFIIKHYKKYDTTIPLKATKFLAKQILYGLSEMANADILHNDLKPENILFTSYLPDIFHKKRSSWVGDVSYITQYDNIDHIDMFNDVLKEMALMKMTVKIIDFGNAFSKKTIKSNKKAFLDSRPTRYYISPEILLRNSFWVKSDMWGFGCILYEMLTGTILFNPHRDNEIGINNMHLCLINMVFGKFPKRLLQSNGVEKYFVNGIHRHRYLIYRTPIDKILINYITDPTELKKTMEFLSRIFTIDPEKRISAFECLMSDWFNTN